MTTATRRAIAEYAARVVAEAPPLSSERLAKLAALWGLRAPRSAAWLDQRAEAA